MALKTFITDAVGGTHEHYHVMPLGIADYNCNKITIPCARNTEQLAYIPIYIVASMSDKQHCNVTMVVLFLLVMRKALIHKV